MTHHQLGLFTSPGVRHDSPGTSRAAAAKVGLGHAARLTRIADMVDDAGYRGMTADEVHQRIVLEDGKAVRSTWHGAVSAACDEGLIVPRGEKHVRMSVNNSPMRIYITPRWQQ